MWQRLRVDHRVLLVYLGFAGSGCRSAPGSVLPSGAQPLDRAQVLQWVDSTLPSTQRLYRFKWLFRDERGSAGGRGSARIAPPDSLRFDVAGPFGSGAGSAVVIGEHPESRLKERTCEAWQTDAYWLGSTRAPPIRLPTPGRQGSRIDWWPKCGIPGPLSAERKRPSTLMVLPRERG